MGFIDENNRLFITNNISESIYFSFVTRNAIRLSTNNGNIRCVGADGGIYDIINIDNSYDYEVIKTLEIPYSITLNCKNKISQIA